MSVSAVKLPPHSDPRWIALVTKGTAKHLNVLALQLILTRVKWQAKADPSPANIKAKIDELGQFFAKNARMLDADLVTLFT